VPTVLVVVVNYNSSGYVADCIRSMDGGSVDRIVVVDNASRQQDREDLVRLLETDDRVTVLPSATNVGFAAGVNLGVRHLDPRDEDVVVVLNPDTRVADGALEALAHTLERGEFDVVSPVIYTGDEQPTVWFAGGRVDLRRGETVHLGYGLTGPPETGNAEVSFVTGAAPAMTGRTWRELGGFREDLFLYWEDADLSLRAAARGKRLGVVGDAVIWHAEGGSAEGPGRGVAFYYYMQRNRIIVLRPVVGLRRLLTGPGAWPVLRTTFRALQEPVGRWRKSACSVMGLWDGIRGRTGQRSLPP
jgi:N-acetylglucosaminyl-diphospho-decaprenol L-rhamnosyltransferase